MRRRGGATNTMQKSKQHRQGPKKTSPNFHTFQHAFLLTQKNKVISSATLNKDETNFFHSLNLKVSRDIKWHVLYSQLYSKSGTSKTNETSRTRTLPRDDCKREIGHSGVWRHSVPWIYLIIYLDRMRSHPRVSYLPLTVIPSFASILLSEIDFSCKREWEWALRMLPNFRK